MIYFVLLSLYFLSCTNHNKNPLSQDHDGDGYSPFDGDCDDDNASLNLDDADGDGLSTCDGDCDDTSAHDTHFVGDCDQDGIETEVDCNDNDAQMIVTRTTDPECDGFYLATNGVTIICPNLPTESMGFVHDVAYTKANRALLEQYLSSGEWDRLNRVCVKDIIDMSYLFSDVSLFDININSWDVNQVTNMSRAFYNASAFNQDISSWDTSNVTDMTAMFFQAFLSIKILEIGMLRRRFIWKECSLIV